MIQRGGLVGRQVRTVVAFDPTENEHPEGVAFDALGRMYVGLAPRGEIRVFETDGSHRTFATIPTGSTWHAILGLGFDDAGFLYAAAPSDAARGVWRFAPDGTGEPIPGSEEIVFANAVTFDQRGTLYVTDSIAGSIWRALPGGRAELWLQDPDLEGLAVLGDLPIGANGIVSMRNRLYVANTEKKQVVAVEIDPDGSPGEVMVVRSFLAEMEFLDGITADVFGNLYVLVAGTSSVVRMSPDGVVTPIGDGGDGLSIPASACFGTRGRASAELFITSLSSPEHVAHPQPNVIALTT